MTIEILSRLNETKVTFCHEFLFGHINDIDPAVNFDDALCDRIDIHETGVDSFNVLAVTEFEALIALLNCDVGVIAAATKASDKGAPCLETSQNISAAFLN